jgi:nucleoside-diphosphate-sugar epimerase
MLNFASGRSHTFRSVAKMVAARAGRAVEIATSARQNPPTHRHFDTTNLLRAFPGVRFKPLDDGLAATFADMRAAASA